MVAEISAAAELKNMGCLTDTHTHTLTHSHSHSHAHGAGRESKDTGTDDLGATWKTSLSPAKGLVNRTLESRIGS